MQEGTLRPPSWSEGRAIHIGLDRVDDDVYRGWLPVLRSAEADARSMRDLSDAMGFASRLIVGEAATYENVRDSLEATIERLTDGDVLVVTFAGHMTSLAGAGDDADGWDEAWCLRDGILLDDEFHDLLAEVPEGADVLVVTDSCFAAGFVDGDEVATGLGGARRSGATNPEQRKTLEVYAGPKLMARAPSTRLGDLEIGRLVREGAIPRGESLPPSQRRAISARVVALAAASEGTLAYDGELHGLFTGALLHAVEDVGGRELSYRELLAAVAERLPFQEPALGVFGPARADVLEATAFGARTVGPAPRPIMPSVRKADFGFPGSPAPSPPRE